MLYTPILCYLVNEYYENTHRNQTRTEKAASLGQTVIPSDNDEKKNEGITFPFETGVEYQKLQRNLKELDLPLLEARNLIVEWLKTALLVKPATVVSSDDPTKSSSDQSKDLDELFKVIETAQVDEVRAYLAKKGLLNIVHQEHNKSVMQWLVWHAVDWLACNKVSKDKIKEIFKLLLESGADLEVQNNEGQTALTFVLQQMLNCKANINEGLYRDAYFTVIKMLFVAGANPHTLMQNNHSAFKIGLQFVGEEYEKAEKAQDAFSRTEFYSQFIDLFLEFGNRLLIPAVAPVSVHQRAQILSRATMSHENLMEFINSRVVEILQTKSPSTPNALTFRQHNLQFHPLGNRDVSPISIEEKEIKGSFINTQNAIDLTTLKMPDGETDCYTFLQNLLQNLGNDPILPVRAAAHRGVIVMPGISSKNQSGGAAAERTHLSEAEYTLECVAPRKDKEELNYFVIEWPANATSIRDVRVDRYKVLIPNADPIYTESFNWKMEKVSEQRRALKAQESLNSDYNNNGTHTIVIGLKKGPQATEGSYVPTRSGTKASPIEIKGVTCTSIANNAPMAVEVSYYRTGTHVVNTVNLLHKETDLQAVATNCQELVQQHNRAYDFTNCKVLSPTAAWNVIKHQDKKIIKELLPEGVELVTAWPQVSGGPVVDAYEFGLNNIRPNMLYMRVKTTTEEACKIAEELNKRFGCFLATFDPNPGVSKDGDATIYFDPTLFIERVVKVSLSNAVRPSPAPLKAAELHKMYKEFSAKVYRIINEEIKTLQVDFSPTDLPEFILLRAHKISCVFENASSGFVGEGEHEGKYYLKFSVSGNAVDSRREMENLIQAINNFSPNSASFDGKDQQILISVKYLASPEQLERCRNAFAMASTNPANKDFIDAQLLKAYVPEHTVQQCLSYISQVRNVNGGSDAFFASMSRLLGVCTNLLSTAVEISVAFAEAREQVDDFKKSRYTFFATDLSDEGRRDLQKNIHNQDKITGYLVAAEKAINSLGMHFRC